MSLKTGLSVMTQINFIIRMIYNGVIYTIIVIKIIDE